MITRRDFVTSLAAAPLVAAAPERPNLLYIVVDQLSGLALPGTNPDARLPNCSRLAREGVTFTNAYTAAMTCGPSRASLDTGLYSQTHGIGGGHRALPDVASLPRSLAENGYISSHPNGYSLEAERKEHEAWLTALGYENPSSLYGVERLARYLDLPLKWKCGRAGLAPEHGFDSYCAQRATRFLENNRDRRFACFLQLRGPHDPYMTPRPFDTLIDPSRLALPPYRDGEFAGKPLRQQRSYESQGASRMADAQIRQMLALYHGMAAYADRAVGQVLDRVEDLGLAGNTVVILVADHGDTLGHHRMFSKDFGFYEPAIRIPMLMRAPGGRPRDIRRTDPVSGVDVFPTLCQLLGLPAPSGVHGESLVERWEKGDRNPDRPIFAAQGVAGKNRAVMVRTQEYKFARYDDGGEELYDLARDPHELVNCANDSSFQPVLMTMRRMMAEWQERCPARPPAS